MSDQPTEDGASSNPKKRLPIVIVSLQGMGKGLILAAIIAVLVLAATLVISYILYNAFIDVSEETQDQPLPTIAPTGAPIGNDLQRFMDAHGPWLSTTDSDNLRTTIGVRNLSLFRSNGLTYSTLSVAFNQDSPWAKYTTPPGITGIDVQGFQVTIQTQGTNMYTLNVTQPFMLDGDLSRIYVVDVGRQLWSARIVDLIFVDTEDVADPEIPANPELSLSFGS